MMNGKQYVRLTHEAGKLLDQYAGYLRFLYDMPWKQLKNQENASLAILSLSLKCDVRDQMIRLFESEMRSVYFFWQAVEQELPLISFEYIDWNVQMQDVMEILVKNEKAEGETAAVVFQHQIDADAEPRKPDRKEERMVLSVRVKKAREQNIRQLKRWLKQYVKLVKLHYNMI